MAEITRLSGHRDRIDLDFVKRERTPEPAMTRGIQSHVAGLSLSNTTDLLEDLGRGGTVEQGPIINLFQTEIAARQLYPDRFNDEELFSRERLGEVIVEGEG